MIGFTSARSGVWLLSNLTYFLFGTRSTLTFYINLELLGIDGDG